MQATQHLVTRGRADGQHGARHRRERHRQGRDGAAPCHELSSRRDGPFVAVNCAAIPENLIESELFGHTKGAFTSADRPRKGLFVQADRGTIFLDEIGELPLSMQTKLLHVLEAKEVRALGSEQSRKVDVRIVAATNRDLPAMVQQGRFREDLFFRLSVFQIPMPPLRERRADIPALLRHVLAHRASRPSGQALVIEPEAEEMLVSFAWPGNVRQLENVLHRAAILADGGTIRVADLPAEVSRVAPGTAAPAPAAGTGGDAELPLRERVRRFEVALILRAIEDAAGDRRVAAQRLGIGLSSLYRKLEEFSGRGLSHGRHGMEFAARTYTFEKQGRSAGGVVVVEGSGNRRAGAGRAHRRRRAGRRGLPARAAGLPARRRGRGDERPEARRERGPCAVAVAAPPSSSTAPTSPSRRRSSTRSAAARDDAEAHAGLANLLLTGRGVAKDEKAAFEHFSKAAQLNHELAIQVVAEAWSKGSFGLDAARDPAGAKAAWERAAARGHLPSAEALQAACARAADTTCEANWRARVVELKRQKLGSNGTKGPLVIRPAAVLALAAAAGCAQAADPLRGSDLYQRHCASCHGGDGRPVMPAAPDLSRPTALLKPDAALPATLRAGRGAMPAYQGQLRDRDILDIVAHLRTLIR